MGQIQQGRCKRFARPKICLEWYRVWTSCTAVNNFTTYCLQVQRSRARVKLSSNARSNCLARRHFTSRYIVRYVIGGTQAITRFKPYYICYSCRWYNQYRTATTLRPRWVYDFHRLIQPAYKLCVNILHELFGVLKMFSPGAHTPLAAIALPMTRLWVWYKVSTLRVLFHVNTGPY